VAFVRQGALRTKSRLWLDGRTDLAELVDAARDASPVAGLTHNFYRYPARFSPRFVRAAIQAFSHPDDLVLDPFVGGGTTLVEALALGRHAIGVDISSLATFISGVKTTLYTDRDIQLLKRWVGRATRAINIHATASATGSEGDASYRRNLYGQSTWRLRKAIQQTLETAVRLRSDKVSSLARCVILRTGQWALDGRKHLPSIEEFRTSLVTNAGEMIRGALELRDTVRNGEHGNKPVIHCINRSTVGLELDPFIRKVATPRLIVTSPPYPGIHVLYHRWQVDGRKETPAPFWIANQLDGSGEVYYSMGSRKAIGLSSYFENMRSTLKSIASLCTRHTTIVQVIAFSNPAWQLSRYLSVADEVGLREAFIPALKNIADGRLWRSVPNRKWYADQKGLTHGSQEVVLFHNLK
jgi:hypothetical protein